MIDVVQALPEHGFYVASHARPADVLEMSAGYSLTPSAAIARGLRVSSQAWAGLVDGVPVAVAGLNRPSLLSSTGYPWMLGTSELERPGVAKAFLRVGGPILQTMLETCEHLENWVDARNTRAIRWLRWLGFTLHDPAPYGPQGLPFCHFEMWRS